MKQPRPARASIRAVAERAGVSIATVSRVVNGMHDKARDATVRRVLDAVAELGYRTQSAGRTLRQREGRIVGVLVANLANPAMAAIAAAIEAALREDFDARLAAVLGEATLPMPQWPRPVLGGRDGHHSEHLGHMLAVMQHLPRSYPDARW